MVESRVQGGRRQQHKELYIEASEIHADFSKIPTDSDFASLDILLPHFVLITLVLPHSICYLHPYFHTIMMAFTNVSHAVQRYPLSPPQSPGEKNEEADRAEKMHQQQSEDLTLQHFLPRQPHQQSQRSQENGVYGNRSTWSGDSEVAAERGFEIAGYGQKATAYYGWHGGWADWQQGQQVSHFV